MTFSGLFWTVAIRSNSQSSALAFWLKAISSILAGCFRRPYARTTFCASLINAAQRFAVNRHDPFDLSCEAACAARASKFKNFSLKQAKHPAERVMYSISIPPPLAGEGFGRHKRWPI